MSILPFLNPFVSLRLYSRDFILLFDLDQHLVPQISHCYFFLTYT